MVHPWGLERVLHMAIQRAFVGVDEDREEVLDGNFAPLGHLQQREEVGRRAG